MKNIYTKSSMLINYNNFFNTGILFVSYWLKCSFPKFEVHIISHLRFYSN